VWKLLVPGTPSSKRTKGTGVYGWKMRIRRGCLFVELQCRRMPHGCTIITESAGVRRSEVSMPEKVVRGLRSR
jgi:hypothetical protein